MDEGNNTIVVAHRGASTVAKENTLAAFDAAIRIGADMTEFDLRRTADGVLVVHHDATVGGEDGPRLAEMSYAEACAAGLALGVEIPRLEEVAELCCGRIGLVMELKERGYEAAAVDALLSHVREERALVVSFHGEAIAAAKGHAPELRTGLCVAPERGRGVREQVPEFPFDAARRAGADWLIAFWEYVTEGLLPVAHEEGFRALAWTVNDEATLHALFELGVDGVASDDPALALEVRRILESEK